MTSRRLTVGTPLVVAALALGASPGCGERRGAGGEAPGQLSAALTGTASAHDVTSVRFKIVAAGQGCDAAAIAEVDKPLEAETLPVPSGADGGSEHRFADALFVLGPRAYHVCATPWAGDHQSTECDRAEADATVTAEVTAELILVSQCRGTPSGGLDVVGALNDPPHIDGLTISDSKFIAVCERATLTVTASDPNGDALAYAWQVASAPEGAAPTLTGAGASATFVTNVPGDYLLRVTVTDTHGAVASLTVPIHVSASGASPPVCADPGTFSPTGSMSVDRAYHAGARLADGKVLVSGGLGHQFVDELASAEIYDPTTHAFTPTGDLRQARYSHTATLLPNGKVLVTGGFAGMGTTLATAELWDPATGAFSSTGSMSVGRLYHTATLLGNGKVLIVGGADPGATPLATAELFDPSTGTFSATGSMAVGRFYHTATLLQDGRVLVAGGYSAWFASVQASAEIYDPSAGTFTATGDMGAARASHTATLLANGEVLIAGGDSASAFTPIASAERYRPSTGTFAPTADLVPARAFHSATRLASGLVLVAGGQGASSYLTDAQLYDPVSATFIPTGGLQTISTLPVVTLLLDGTVLFAGGVAGPNGQPVLADAALYSRP